MLHLLYGAPQESGKILNCSSVFSEDQQRALTEEYDHRLVPILFS